ncbi:MAG: hypothetical protein R6W66_04690, partial [Pelovirga sp.]
LTPEQSEQALEIGLPGLYAEPVSQRSYPSGAVAGSILGFMGADGPLEGIEAAQGACTCCKQDTGRASRRDR